MSQLDNSGQVSPTPPLTTLLSGPQSRVIGDKTLQNQSVGKYEIMIKSVGVQIFLSLAFTNWSTAFALDEEKLD